MSKNSKAKSLIAKAKEKGLIKSYSQFCKTKEAKDIMLKEEEIDYYIHKQKGDKNEKI